MPAALDALFAQLDPQRGYVAVMAYLDRLADADLAECRVPLARRTERPTTFGWGPRFLHSTGQFHKGGPAVGVYLQITTAPKEDLAIPGREFTFGDFIASQAGGDAAVLADHGRPVLQLHLTDHDAGLAQLRDGAAGRRACMSPARIAHGHNPLRTAEDKRLPRIAGPCGLVLFGVTGDLARKKLMPAIYDLANRGLLPPGFSLVGFARRDWATQDFGQVVHDAVKQHARTPFSEDVWRNLSEGFRFVPGTFDDPAAFDLLAKTVDELDADRGTGGNHAFYLSIPPGFFATVCEQLERCGLTHRRG